MLIRFVVKNFLSFNDETEFNMLAGNVRRHNSHITNFKNIKLLKSSVIYGANGSGKSNLIHAMNLLEETILNGELIQFADANKFKLKPENIDLPISFEVEFIMNNKAFAYKLAFQKGVIVEEWLYKLNFGKAADNLLFERKKGKNSKIKLEFNPKYLKTPKSKVLKQVFEEDLLKDDMPFLYLARSHKFKEINDAFSWFLEGMLIIHPGSKFKGLAGIIRQDEEFKSFTNNLIVNLGTGIKRVEVKKIDFNIFFGEDNLEEKQRIYKELLENEKVNVGDDSTATAFIENGKAVVYKLYTIHENILGEDIEFELFEESDGSLRLFDFLPAIHMALNYPVIIVIDEIDQSIHVNLLKELIRKIQAKGELIGQIIFTTHESNLLDLDIFRQDEIWFSEKDTIGATHFYPLSDYNIRIEMDISKGYLSGRFGAIPFLSNLKDLNWTKNGEEK